MNSLCKYNHNISLHIEVRNRNLEALTLYTQSLNQYVCFQLIVWHFVQSVDMTYGRFHTIERKIIQPKECYPLGCCGYSYARYLFRLHRVQVRVCDSCPYAMPCFLEQDIVGCQTTTRKLTTWMMFSWKTTRKMTPWML